MSVSLRTPKGWRRIKLKDDLTKLIAEARPLLGEGRVTDSAGWVDKSGNVRRIELEFENGGYFKLRIDRRGRQSSEEGIKLVSMALKGQAA